MKYIILLFLSLLTGCFSSDQKKGHFAHQIEEIPLKDRQKLEILFQRMLTGDYFAATLFGNKPLTFQEFHDDPWKMSSYCMVNPCNHFYLDEGWQTWIKYQKLFPSRNFIFTKIPAKVGYAFLVLINKKAFRNLFEANRDIFEQALGSHITAEKIFQDFEKQQKTFEQILNDHEGLVGLVLGYGRDASMSSYHIWMLEMQILNDILYPLSSPLEDHELPRTILHGLKLQEKKLTQSSVKWNQTCCQLMAKQDPYATLGTINGQMEFLLPPWQEHIFHILPPNFTVVKDSVEAKELKEEYEHALEIARGTFRSQSFLSGFLKRYCK